MVFSSPYFLFLFLPIALLVCLPGRGATFRWLLFSVSMIFYFWSSGLHVFLLLGVILLNFFGAQFVAGKNNWAIFVALVSINISIMFIFKYVNFFLVNVDAIFHTEFNGRLGVMVLPAGISFFVFQGISYLFDVRQGVISADRGFATYAAYQAFFPHLIAGPIVRYRDVIQDFLSPRISSEHFAIGVTRFAHGLLKKVVIADTIAPMAEAAFGLSVDKINFVSGWTGATAYALQIYFDFSGYSDMAIGLAAMFGIRFTENFARPYSSRSITEFWRRWHITLSSWFRDYVYIPLGGSRNGALVTARNLFIVFIITGLWHGAAWTFLFWGLYHGAFLVMERLVLGGRRETLTHWSWRYFYVLPVVVFGWVLFRSESMGQAMAMWRAMLAPVGLPGYNDVWSSVPGLTPQAAVAFLAGGLMFILPGQTSFGLRLMSEPSKPLWQTVNATYTITALMASAVIVLTGTYSPFLYFTF